MRKSPRQSNGRAASTPRSGRAMSTSSNELQDIWLGLSESFGEPKRRELSVRTAWKSEQDHLRSNGETQKLNKSKRRQPSAKSSNVRQNDGLNCSPIAGIDTRQQASFEKVLHEHLHRLQQLLLFRNAVLLGHSAEVVGDYVEKMAQETLETQLTLAINEKVRLEGPKARHRASAYESVSKDLIESLRAAIASDDFEHLKHMQETCRRDTAVAQQRQLQAEQALQGRERDMQVLEQRCDELRATIKQLEDGKKVLQNEVEKALSEQFRYQQQLVELRIQTYNLCLDLQRRCANVLHSVQSRMGFVPSTIQHEIDNLLSLQPALES